MTGAARERPTGGHCPDEIDLLILDRLQADGSLSNKSLAHAVGLSPSACLERVRKLETAGVIEGYRAVIAKDGFGDHFEAWVTMRLPDRSATALEGIARVLSDSELVTEAYEVAGPFDLLAHIVAPLQSDWRRLERVLTGACCGLGMRLCVVVAQTKAPTGLPVRRLARRD
jgi:DNA-binding Lrp family transcriptional regulator